VPSARLHKCDQEEIHTTEPKSHSPELRYIFWPPRRPENVAQLRAHIVKLCHALSEDLCQKVVTNARVRLQEVVSQNGGHIEHVLH